MIAILLAVAAWPACSADLRFVPGEGGEFRFDTGVLSGVARAGGKSRGLSSVVHRPTGLPLTQTRLSFGLLSVYRVFVAGRRLGPAAWDWPGDGRLLPDGSLETFWPETAERPFTLSTRYRWRDSSTVEMEATVRASTALPDFEVFVASYFSDRFTPAQVYARTQAGPHWVEAGDSAGEWLIFPRDDAAVRLIRSGRWLLPPNPIEWVVMPPLAAPVAMRRDARSGLATVLMARPGDAIAVAAPRGSDIHYSTYVSLFGRTIEVGKPASAAVRLAISTDAPLDLYRSWVR